MTTDIDVDSLMEMLEMGDTPSQMAAKTGLSPATLQKRVAHLLQCQPEVERYRSLQHVQLTELQARVLESITDEMLANASLKDLIGAFKILKEKEQTDLGKPTEIKGLVAYLVHIEKEDLEAKNKSTIQAENVVETTATVVRPDPKKSFADGVPQF